MAGKAKKIVMTLLVLAVLAVAVVIGGTMLLDRRIEEEVARKLDGGSAEVEGIPVRIGGVDVSSLTGEGRIEHLTLGNPPGFPKGTALECESVTLDVDVKSLRGKEVRVREATINRPVINLQQEPGKLSNIALLERKLNAGLAELDKQLGGTQVTVERLRVQGGRFVCRTAAPCSWMTSR